MKHLILLAIVLLFCVGCDDQPNRDTPSSIDNASVWFQDVTAASGIDFVHESGHSGEAYFIPEIVSGGAAVFDMNNNGFLDVYLVQSGSILVDRHDRPGNQLYRNRGDGTFENVTEGSGADDRGFGMGVTIGDYNNNGFIDLYIANVGRNTLLRNNGDETFTDVTEEAGVGDDRFGASATMLDYTGDGNLDIFITNYLTWSPETEMECYNDLGSRDYCGPLNYRAPARDTLYRNNGDGTFDDVTETSGIASDFGNGLGVGCADFTGNGWIDIFVANDGNPDQLWANQGDGTFVDIALSSGCAVDMEGIAKAGMGVAIADVNDNGLPDLLVCNLRGETDSFFINKGGYFIDRTGPAGLRATSRAFTRFGMALLDFDNDGTLDLYQVNGRVYREAMLFSEDPYAEPNLLFRGHADGRFTPTELRGGMRNELFATGRAAAFGDLNNNGSIDIVIANCNGPAHVLWNVIGDDNNWVMFRVLDEHDRDALNATVTLQMGERTVHRDVRSGYSYLAANDPRVHFGLGVVDRVEGVTVRWLDGSEEYFGSHTANAIYTLRRGEGTIVPDSAERTREDSNLRPSV